MNVLIFGDSHSVGFVGQILAGLLTAQGATVTVNAKVGRSAISYLQLEGGISAFKKVLVASKPNVVLFILGTNDASRSLALTADALSQLRQVATASGADTWHIGPPAFADKTLTAGSRKVAEVGKQIFSESRFIDSEPITKNVLTLAEGRAGDGVHFAKAGATVWANGILEALREKSKPKSSAKASPLLKLIVAALGGPIGIWFYKRRSGKI